MRITVRFEDAISSEVSREYGPYPFIQLTHELLRYGPDGEDIAFLDGQQMWRPLDGGKAYSDVVIGEAS